MNERIDELLEKCRTTKLGCYGFPVVEFDEKKLVKLIVYDFLDDLTNDDTLGPERSNSIKRLAEKWGVSR